jgi:hypothetical protein
MDPVTLVATLSAGAAVAGGSGAAAGLTEVVKVSVVDAYTACKKAIRSRFGDDEDAKEKLAQLEVRPDDAALQEAVAGYVQAHGAGEDAAVVQAAGVLRVQLARIGGGVGSITTGDVRDNTMTADRGGIATINLAGGATAGYAVGAAAGSEDADPRWPGTAYRRAFPVPGGPTSRTAARSPRARSTT